MLVSGSYDGEVKCWALDGHGAKQLSNYSIDKYRATETIGTIGTGVKEGTIRTKEGTIGTKGVTIGSKGVTTGVTGVAFVHESKLLVSASDSVLRLIGISLILFICI